MKVPSLDPRAMRFLGLVAVLAVASALVTRRPSAPIPSYLARPPAIYPDLRLAAQSSSDLNMIQNLAASVKGHERLLNPRTAFTVFAPRNTAFAGLPRSLLNEIWLPENALWSRVFWHHVLAGNFRREELRDGQVLHPLDGSPLRVSLSADRLLVDGVAVVGMLLSESSVIYVTDSLLVPESAKAEFRTRRY